MWTLISNFELLDGYYCQRHMQYCLENGTSKFTEFNIKQDHRHKESDPENFSVELKMSTQQDAETFVSFFNRIHANDQNHKCPRPTIEAEKNYVEILFESKQLEHIYQIMLIAAAFDVNFNPNSDLKMLVLTEIKNQFLPVYGVTQFTSIFEIRERLDKKNRIIAPTENKYNDLDAYHATLVARGLKIIRERQRFERKDTRNLDKITAALSKTIETKTEMSTQFKLK